MERIRGFFSWIQVSKAKKTFEFTHAAKAWKGIVVSPSTKKAPVTVSQNLEMLHVYIYDML